MRVGRRFRKTIGYIIIVLAFGVGLIFSSIPAAAQDPQNFTIQSFEADYYLGRTESKVSAMRVTEKIVAEFPVSDQNHGILRAIPKTYKDHPTNLKIESVTDASGHALSYSTETENDNLVLKIGDADTFVHGEQHYKISYHMQHVTTNFDDHDELFWDINGDQWSQPSGSVTARLHVPADIATVLDTDKRCYVGTAGSTEQSCHMTTDKEGEGGVLITMASTRPLEPGETMSIVLGFASGSFAKYTVPLSQIIWTTVAIIVLGFLPPIAALVFMLRKWGAYGRDAKGRGTIVVQYLPPKELSVLASSGVLKQSFATSAVSAQILDLAVRHYIKVYEQKEKALFKDKTAYSLELVKTPTDLRSEEKAVVSMLFGEAAAVGKKIKLKDLSSKLYKKSAELGKALDKQLASEGYFVKPPSQVFQTYIGWGCALLAIGFAGLFIVPYMFGLVLAGAIILGMARLMPARTQKGVDMRDYLFGLRDYMKLAEADRIKTLQSPHGELTEKIDTTDEKQLLVLYERLLPYAMLFGIEQAWAKEFAGLYHDQSPDWYSGTGVFNAVYFAGAMHGFSAASTTAFSPPSSSSSSGFSGGGAGGGGGGGGGGGW